MIDLSAVFDTVDIPIVLQILKEDFGINDAPLAWVESYLTNRTMKVETKRKMKQNIFKGKSFEIWCTPGFLCSTGDIHDVYRCLE